ncbi:hypothetical protein MKEN_01303000 [Mycena kentingensis (nom. inval.)]|nr:hypothetical protein MKEN_01303000 [Mycena kentingensis (nom. inval.)]
MAPEASLPSIHELFPDYLLRPVVHAPTKTALRSPSPHSPNEYAYYLPPSFPSCLTPRTSFAGGWYRPSERPATPEPPTPTGTEHSGGSGSGSALELVWTAESVSDGEDAEGDSARYLAKRHVCPQCNKRFNRPSSLRIHTNSHTGATPFVCPFPECGRAFNVNSNMRRHFRNHSVALSSAAAANAAGVYSTCSAADVLAETERRGRMVAGPAHAHGSSRGLLEHNLDAGGPWTHTHTHTQRRHTRTPPPMPMPPPGLEFLPRALPPFPQLRPRPPPPNKPAPTPAHVPVVVHHPAPERHHPYALRSRDRRVPAPAPSQQAQLIPVAKWDA